jgi:glutamate/aspartate transport system substrate-binding protein
MRTFVIATLLTALTLYPAVTHAEEADAALKRIEANKSITIGFRESAAPFAFLNKAQKPDGYSIAICNRIANAIGTRLKIENLQIKYVPVSPQTRIPLIANGTVDIECGTTVISLARQQQVDFTYPVALAEGRLLVRKGSGIKSLADLDGKIVAVASGTTAERYVPAVLSARRLSARILQVRDNGEGLLAVSSKRADAFINDAILLGGALHAAANKDDFEVVGGPLSFEQVAFMAAKNNSGLLTIANQTIARMLTSGEMAALYNQWVSPLGAPIEGEVAALFKVNAIPE